MCLNTPKDTAVFKQTERHRCAQIQQKAQMCLNTTKDTDVLKHSKRHGCS